MRKSLLFLVISVLFLNCWTIYGEEQFPDDKIKNIKVVELEPDNLRTFDNYVQRNLQDLNEYYEWWSTIYPQKNFSKYTLTTMASSTLGNSYQSANLCDGKAETAWVPKRKSGIGEWAKLAIDAYSALAEITTTPFSIFEIAVIPGYAKSAQTWSENNRVKTLMVIIHSLPPVAAGKNEWVAFRLHLKDDNRFQIFMLPDDTQSFNMGPMKKEIWIKIEDIYRGTKYDDACISEFVAVGGFSS